MRWAEKLTAACMVATLVIAVIYNERNYRLSRRNAEISEEQLKLAKQSVKSTSQRLHEAFERNPS